MRVTELTRAGPLLDNEIRWVGLRERPVEMEIREMDYTGRVRGGVVVLDGPEPIAEGTVVTIRIAQATPTECTFSELFEEIAGKAVDLPPDLAENHDHYIHGLPKHSAS